MSEWASDKSLKTCVLYALNLLIDDKDAILKEIRREILGIQNKTENKSDDIENKIEILENKKVKLIDLRLAGEITSDELKIQKEHIDNEIDELKDRLNNNNNRSGVLQLNRIQAIFSEIDKILSFDYQDVDSVLGTILEKIIVYEGHKLEIYLKDIPFVFEIVYKSTGRLETYRTEILSCEII